MAEQPAVVPEKDASLEKHATRSDEGDADKAEDSNEDASKASSNATISFTQTLFLGSAAGFVAELALYPLEGNLARHRLPGGLDWHGVGKDLNLVLARKAPATGLLVASYELVRQELRRQGIVPSNASSPWEHISHGAAAATIAQILETTVWAPVANMQLERDRLILAGQSEVPSTPRLIFRTLFQQGLRPLYRGSFSNFLATFPTVSLYYGISDALVLRAKQRELEVHPEEAGKAEKEISLGLLAGIGAASSFIAVCIATPLELIRARLVTWNREPIAAAAGADPKTVLERATKSSARKAVFSLFRNSVRNALSKGGLRTMVRGMARRALANPIPLRRIISSSFGRFVKIVISRGKAR